MTWKRLLHSPGVVCRHMTPYFVDLKASKHSDCVSRSCFLFTEIKARSRLDSCGRESFLRDALIEACYGNKTNIYSWEK